MMKKDIGKYLDKIVTSDDTGNILSYLQYTSLYCISEEKGF